ncbi:MAG: hypothetical protein AAF333_16030 [Planctomycetota bacterium]
MSQPPRSAAAILADLQKLDLENDRLELRIALAQQKLRAAQAHASDESPNADRLDDHLARAARLLRQAG